MIKLESLKESVKNVNFNWAEFRVSDIIWLIEQADKVERLEKENSAMQRVIEDL